MAVVSFELSTSCMANQWLFWSLWMTCIYGKRAIFIVYLVPVWASGLSAFNFICSAYTWAQMPTKQIAHGILAYNINNVSTHQVVLQKVQQFWKYYLDKWRIQFMMHHHTKLGYEILNGSETKLSSGKSPDTLTHQWFQHITTTTTNTTTTLFWGV